MDHQERLYTPYHDEHVVDYILLFDWYYLLVLWQDLQEVDKKL